MEVQKINKGQKITIDSAAGRGVKQNSTQKTDKTSLSCLKDLQVFGTSVALHPKPPAILSPLDCRLQPSRPVAHLAGRTTTVLLPKPPSEPNPKRNKARRSSGSFHREDEAEVKTKEPAKDQDVPSQDVYYDDDDDEEDRFVREMQRQIRKLTRSRYKVSVSPALSGVLEDDE